MAVMIALVGAMFVVIQSAQAAPSLVVATSDSDDVIKPGDRVDILAYVKEPVDGASYFLDYALASNGIIYTAVVDPDDAVDGTATAPTKVGSVLAPSTADGTYTVSVRVRNDATAAGATAFVPGEVTIMVGEVGEAIASVEVSLGKVGHSSLTKKATDKDTTPAYGPTKPTNYEACGDASTADNADDVTSVNCIAITVDVKNSLGNATNNAEVSTVHVFAALADVYVPPTEDAADNSGEFTATATNGASTKFFVAKEKPGTVDVYAIAIGPSGSATSATMTLSFTGTADSVALGDVSGPLAVDGSFAVAASDGPPVVKEADAFGTAKVEVTATDASGNVATLESEVDSNFDGDTDDNEESAGEIGAANVSIVNADDEEIDTIEARVTQKKNSDGDPVATAVVIELASTGDTEPGDYTLQVTFGDNDPVTADLVVSGVPATVEIETSASSVTVGDIITVTATVTDKDGHNVADDAGNVTFNAVGALKLVALDDTDTDMGGAQEPTDDGVAEVRYVVVDGSGTATIIATIGKADAVTAVSTEAAEAMPEEEASVACLSNLAGFSTWSCGVETSASEIFGFVSARGATAIHLWNGSAWVRYSVVDGTMVPGSSDFMVAENDILYISN